MILCESSPHRISNKAENQSTDYTDELELKAEIQSADFADQIIIHRLRLRLVEAYGSESRFPQIYSFG
jgi:hypothetical protein